MSQIGYTQGHLNSIQVGSNEMPFTAWKHTERNRQRDRKKYVMIAGGFVIVIRNNSFIDSIIQSLPSIIQKYILNTPTRNLVVFLILASKYYITQPLSIQLHQQKDDKYMKTIGLMRTLTNKYVQFIVRRQCSCSKKQVLLLVLI